VAAELETHGREDLRREIILPREVKRSYSDSVRTERGRRIRFGNDRPAAFAGIGDAAGVTLEGGLLEKGNGGEIEQPRGDYAAAAPDFGDVGEIEVVLIVLGVAERRGFGVGFVSELANVWRVSKCLGLRRRRPSGRTRCRCGPFLRNGRPQTDRSGDSLLRRCRRIFRDPECDPRYPARERVS